MSVAVDPDALLRLFRRVSYRSALTASLATRLVPVLARDATRMSDAARCRPARRPSGRGSLHPRRGARPLGGPGRGAGAARLRAGRAARAAASCPGRATTSAWPPRRPSSPLSVAGRDCGCGLGGLLSAPGVELGAPELALGRAARAAGRRAVRWGGRATGGGPCLSRWCAPRASPTPTPRPPAGAAGRELELEPGTFTVLAGVSGSGKSTLLRAALRAGAPLPRRRRAPGSSSVAGMPVRDHGPGELAARVRDGAPGPGVAGGDGRRDGRAGAAARARRRAPGRGGPRGGGDRAGSGGGPPPGPPHRHPVRR